MAKIKMNIRSNHGDILIKGRDGKRKWYRRGKKIPRIRMYPNDTLAITTHRHVRDSEEELIPIVLYFEASWGEAKSEKRMDSGSGDNNSPTSGSEVV